MGQSFDTIKQCPLGKCPCTREICKTIPVQFLAYVCSTLMAIDKTVSDLRECVSTPPTYSGVSVHPLAAVYGCNIGSL